MSVWVVGQGRENILPREDEQLRISNRPHISCAPAKEIDVTSKRVDFVFFKERAYLLPPPLTQRIPISPKKSPASRRFMIIPDFLWKYRPTSINWVIRHISLFLWRIWSREIFGCLLMPASFQSNEWAFIWHTDYFISFNLNLSSSQTRNLLLPDHFQHSVGNNEHFPCHLPVSTHQVAWSEDVGAHFEDEVVQEFWSTFMKYRHL